MLASAEPVAMAAVEPVPVSVLLAATVVTVQHNWQRKMHHVLRQILKNGMANSPG